MDSSKWCFEKNILSLQKIDASNRSSWQQLFPKTTVTRKKLNAISTLKEEVFLLQSHKKRAWFSYFANIMSDNSLKQIL